MPPLNEISDVLGGLPTVEHLFPPPPGENGTLCHQTAPNWGSIERGAVVCRLMGDDVEKPLRRIAESFEGLARTVNSNPPDLGSAEFSNACSLVSPLFGCLGIAFKFAETDYVAKVEDLKEASKMIKSLQLLLEQDIERDSVRKPGSHTRNLLRVKRGLDMVRLLFEKIIVEEGNSLRSAASFAYEEVFSRHHGWAIRKAVAVGMYALPTKSQLLRKLNEDEASARLHMQKYAAASESVIRYVEELFHSRELGVDW